MQCLKWKRLCSKNEDTKSESNSQRIWRNSCCRPNCVQRTKIQNLKAIHNSRPRGKNTNKLCSKNEDTKSESNSQLLLLHPEPFPHCVQRTKIQNLKAIHNRFVNENIIAVIVFKERRYKIWKQFTTKASVPLHVPILCSKNEDTKSESNSQLLEHLHLHLRLTTLSHCINVHLGLHT